VEDQDRLDPTVGDARRPADLRQRLPVSHAVALKGEMWEIGVVLWEIVG
jgi:hypothetical protein